MDNLAEVAVKGGERIQSVVRGKSVSGTLSFQEWVTILEDYWMDEDWPPVLSNPFMAWVGKDVFAGDMGTYSFHIARPLATCNMPFEGILVL